MTTVWRKKAPAGYRSANSLQKGDCFEWTRYVVQAKSVKRRTERGRLRVEITIQHPLRDDDLVLHYFSHEHVRMAEGPAREILR